MFAVLKKKSDRLYIENGPVRFVLKEARASIKRGLIAYASRTVKEPSRHQSRLSSNAFAKTIHNYRVNAKLHTPIDLKVVICGKYINLNKVTKI